MTNCLAVATCEVLKCPLIELFNFIGASGNEKIFDCKEPFCYRGFHLQEIVLFALYKGYACIFFEKKSRLECYLNDQSIDIKVNYQPYLKNNDGVIYLGFNEKEIPHAQINNPLFNTIGYLIFYRLDSRNNPNP